MPQEHFIFCSIYFLFMKLHKNMSVILKVSFKIHSMPHYLHLACLIAQPHICMSYLLSCCDNFQPPGNPPACAKHHLLFSFLLTTPPSPNLPALNFLKPSKVYLYLQHVADAFIQCFVVYIKFSFIQLSNQTIMMQQHLWKCRNLTDPGHKLHKISDLCKMFRSNISMEIIFDYID